ncbi:MAG TPA: hypothetical protein VMR34_03080 [Candidatus Saccharimonadales bacterium]|nr:hypothetical protein [Candidatus Saccharimonadales bacterium]
MKRLSIITASIATIGLVGSVGVGVANAASSNNSGDVGTSGIPRSVFIEDRLDAVAQVLNTSTSNIQAAHKDKTLKTLIANDGLTRQSFNQKVKADLTAELENAGYTQDQVTIALQHRTILRLRHHDK